MAQAPTSIFNSKATAKLRSPDDLDKYVQVTNPSVWVVLAACLLLLIGLLSWGVFGSVSSNVSTKGVVIEGEAICYLSGDDAVEVRPGQDANVGGFHMVVDSVAPTPQSPDEARGLLSSDYLVSTLVKGDWAYQVKFKGNTSMLAENVPLPVTITTERIAPLSLILKNWG